VRSLAFLLLVPAVGGADGDLRRVGQWRFARYGHDQMGGGGRDAARVVWDGSYQTGYFSPTPRNWVLLDQGDVSDASLIQEFEIGYATDWVTSAGLNIDLIFYTHENGWNSRQREPVAAFRLHGLPGALPNSVTGWIVSVPIDAQGGFRLLGPDLESGPHDPSGGYAVCHGFGLADFGFSYRFRNAPSSQLTGPLYTWFDPNVVPCAAPGVNNAEDIFEGDPNPADPNEMLFPGVNVPYVWTRSFGSWPYPQYHMKLTTREAAPPCPALEAPCWNADIAPGAGIRAGGGDCVVDLGDLSVLLANFGTTSGAAFADGDIDPPLNLDTLAVGDGDVDLADLSRLLAAYGADCR
jgi:hypothetical protein